SSALTGPADEQRSGPPWCLEESDRSRHTDATGEVMHSHSIGASRTEQTSGRRQRRGARKLARKRDPALEIGDNYVLHRPPTGSEGHRRDRRIPGSTLEPSRF